MAKKSIPLSVEIKETYKSVYKHMDSWRELAQNQFNYIIGTDVSREEDNFYSTTFIPTTARPYDSPGIVSGTTSLSSIFGESEDKKRKVLTEKNENRIRFNKYGERIYKNREISFSFPQIQRVAARTIGLDLVSVQPISGPTGTLNYFDYNYGVSSGTTM